MVKGVTKNREGEKTKVTGCLRNGNEDADPTFANGRHMRATSLSSSMRLGCLNQQHLSATSPM